MLHILSGLNNCQFGLTLSFLRLFEVHVFGNKQALHLLWYKLRT